MAAGAGKYDELCTVVREQTGGQGAAIIVVEGNKGHGFSVQMTADDMMILPGTLEDMAATMRRDMGIVQLTDATRWQFLMASVKNPNGPEDSMGKAVGKEIEKQFAEQGKDGDDAEMMVAIIDESIKRLAGVK